MIDELSACATGRPRRSSEQLLSRTEYREHLKADSRDNGEDRLANLDELITAAREFDQAHPGASIQDFLAEITLASPIDRWDEDSGAVTLDDAARRQGARVSGRLHRRARERPLAPRPRRLITTINSRRSGGCFFVGITRARRELYLSRCVVRTFRGQQQATYPSQFLDELPEGPIVVRDLSGVGRPGYRPDVPWRSSASLTASEPRPPGRAP